MKEKFQIFVSSTYEDLKDERDLVIKAILEMGHIPVGMEMFSAGDEQQWKLIQTQIDDCDYYVVIIAFRYGSLAGEISYTEKEYDYAISKGIPVLGFLIQEGVSWSASKIDKKSLKVEKLESFKQKIQGKLVSYWKDKNDLYGKVSIALMKQFNTNPRVGWVKSSEHFGPEVLKEISRLSTENAVLRKELKAYVEQIDKEKKETFQRTLNTLKHNKRELSFYYDNGKEWEDESEFSLLEIFNLLAPELMIENSTEYCSTFLGFMLKPDEDREVREKWPTAMNNVHTILADLNALGIIQPSLKKHSIKDENKYWSLTEDGKKLLREVRLELLEQTLEKVENSDLEDLENIKETPKKKKNKKLAKKIKA
ncbi:MAG: DUF4062 domain-containing protein [Bacteroidetes bacterium]|nr:DUF4062 domain-containing protein [Bacteroidota bacterium]